MNNATLPFECYMDAIKLINQFRRLPKVSEIQRNMCVGFAMAHEIYLFLCDFTSGKDQGHA